MSPLHRPCTRVLHATASAALAAFLLGLQALPAAARVNPQPAADAALLDRGPYEVSAPERKTASLFLRPARRTPAEQFRLAEELEQKGRHRAARRAYDALVHRWHAAPEAPRAQLGVARLRERQGHHLRAFREYQYAMEHFPNFLSHEEAVERQFAIANLLRSELDQGWFGFGREAGAEEVVALFRQVARNAPSGPRAPDCLLFMGLTYESEKQWEEALSPYESLAARFPSHELTGTALFRAAQCRVRLTEKNPRDEQRLRNALSALTALQRDYPGHPDSEQIEAWRATLRDRLVRMQFEQAAFYDRSRKNPAGAIVAYAEFIRTFAAWPEAAAALETARRRLADLEAQPSAAATPQTPSSPSPVEDPP